jgi:hypothetical protein
MLLRILADPDVFSRRLLVLLETVTSHARSLRPGMARCTLLATATLGDELAGS